MTIANKPKRTTIYLDPELHRALRLKAIAVSQSVSELVNNAVRECLEGDTGSKRRILKARWQEASKDPKFIKDIRAVEREFKQADDETAGRLDR